MTAKRLFAKKTTEFKSSASEALATYPVMRIFLQDSLPTLGDNHARLCCHSFFALCDVLDTLQMLGSTGNVNAEADDLDAKVCRHLQLFKSCYGETRVLPKAHMNLHLGDFLRRHGCLLSCFVHERRHKEIKRYANNMDNMQTGSEKHLLQMELEKHLDNLKTFSEKRKGLISPHEAPDALKQSFREFFGLPACPSLQFSNRRFVGSGRNCRHEDVIVARVDNRAQVAQVWFHVHFAGQVYTCVSVWSRYLFMCPTSPSFAYTSWKVTVLWSCPCLSQCEYDTNSAGKNSRRCLRRGDSRSETVAMMILFSRGTCLF